MGKAPSNEASCQAPPITSTIGRYLLPGWKVPTLVFEDISLPLAVVGCFVALLIHHVTSVTQFAIDTQRRRNESKVIIQEH